jgi:arabinofuranosyltransferase
MPPTLSLASPRAQGYAFVGVVLVYLAAVAYYLTVIGPYIVDDAFIYFRYADNFAHGHGLVYNPGERVEGYTGLSWVLLLAAAAALGLPLIASAQGLGVLLGGATLFLTWRCAVCWLGARPAALLPALFLATQRSFVAWSLEGLETQLFTLLLCACLLTWLRQPSGRSVAVGSLAGLMTWTRPEGLLFAGLIAVCALGQSVRTKAYAWLVRNALVYLSIVAAQLVFRWVYYHDILPNPYYAKVVGAQTARGFAYLGALCEESHVAFYALFTLLGIAAFARNGEHAAQRRWSIAAVFAYAGYVVFIGGDYFELRFFVPVLPLVAIWTIAGVLQLLAAASSRAARSGILVVSSAAWLGANLLNSAQPPEDSLDITTVEAEARYTETFVKVARWLALNVRPDDYLAIRPAGAIAYFTRVRCLDLLGLNDRAIARDPSFVALANSAGHQRAVPRDYLGQRGVTYYIGHPQLSQAPARPGGGYLSAEIEPGEFFIVHRMAADAALADRIYTLGEHAGSLQGWEPVSR